MAIALIHSRAQCGVQAPPVQVEVHLSGGLPGMSIVGLPEAAVRESKDRVRAALLCAQFEMPQRRITVNLAPADLPKDGARFDLPIALGILVASGQVPADAVAGLEFIGELALTGELRGVHGALTAALGAGRDGRGVVLPRANADEAGLAGAVDVLPADSLLQVCAHLRGEDRLSCFVAANDPPVDAQRPDLRDVIGQPIARRALEIAAAGGHHLLTLGLIKAQSALRARIERAIVSDCRHRIICQSHAVSLSASTFPRCCSAGLLRSPDCSGGVPCLSSKRLRLSWNSMRTNCGGGGLRGESAPRRLKRRAATSMSPRKRRMARRGPTRRETTRPRQKAPRTNRLQQLR